MEYLTNFCRRACVLAERWYDYREPETLPVKLSEVFPKMGHLREGGPGWTI